MKEAVKVSIHSRHNTSKVGMYSGYNGGMLYVDARLYQDLSVEFGLIRVVLHMIRNTKSLMFSTVQGELRTKKLLECIHSCMNREGRYVRGVYGIWGHEVGIPCSILHKQLLDTNDMLVFTDTGGMYYNYLDVVDTDTTIRVPVELFQKRVMLNTAINFQSIKDIIYEYLETVLDAMYNK